MGAGNNQSRAVNNPLLQFRRLPPFSRIEPHHVEPAIDQILEENRAAKESLLETDSPTWQSLIEPLEALAHRLDRVWSPVSHLNAVCNDEQLRAAYNNCLTKLSDYATELTQDRRLFEAYQAVQQNEGEQLDPAQQRLLTLSLREFRLAGVALTGEQKARFRALIQELTRLQAKFEENLLDCVNAWSCHIEDERELAGVPARAMQRARDEARSRNTDGYVFTLDYPSFHAIVTHADSAALRKRFYEAWVTRASNAGPHDARWDNRAVMEQILAHRYEVARLVGFDNFAEYSLATKMAKSIDQVRGFLTDLSARSRAVAQREFRELEQFAGTRLEAWDIAYYSDKMREHRFKLSDEVLRPYFPVDRVIHGMFDIVRTLYDIEVVERPSVDAWHDQVRFFDVRDANGTYRGGFYADLYARQFKRGGAWMDDCIGRIRAPDKEADPIAYLTCNFMPPVGDAPALLTHDEVLTLFHEFGHVLHHILTQVDYPSVAGINGVAWDAVELPSQFMENFCWSSEGLAMISGHFETGEPLPDSLFERLLGSRNFLAGMAMVRQLEFALFDMRLHAEYQPAAGARIEAILADVRDQVAVVPTPEFNRFPNSFAHVFGGGYAAGYYSYKWAEVLSADAFSAFEETGVLDNSTGQRFLESILQRGGGVDPMQAFVDFRGREPQLEPLLRHCGIGGASQ